MAEQATVRERKAAGRVPSPGQMVVRHAVGALILLGALAGSSCNEVAIERAPDPSRPDILLVTIDTLRADHAGAPYGDAPTLQRLADEGVRFERAMAPTPLTLPSHASLLTGLYPPRHGVRHNGVFTLGEEFVTVAERLRDAGYQTGAIVAAAVLDERFGLGQGFDSFDDDMGDQRASAAGYPERRADEITDRAIAWVEQADRPFFLWVHYYDVHASYTPPEPFASRYASAPYRGEVAYVDRELGRLVDSLETAGRLDDTVVAVTSDHGEGLGQHGEGTHSYLIYDSVLHVPLFVRGPGIPGGYRVPDVVSNVGLAATLTSLAGAETLPDVDVGNLADYWAAAEGEDVAAAGRGYVYAESLAGRLDFGWSPIYAIRTDRHHYIRAPRPELFAHPEDPGQTRNLLEPADGGASDEIVASLDGRIAALIGEQDLAVPAQLDAATRAQIEALGYAVPSGETRENGADPKDVHVRAARVHDALGHVLEGRLAEAEAIARDALEVMPESGQVYSILAQVELARGRPDLALGHAERAAALYAQGADYHVQLGFVRVALGDFAGAVSAFDEALALDPTHPGAHTGAMWRRRLGGSLDEAIAHASSAREYTREPANTAEAIGALWDKLGEYDLALSTFRGALEEYPERQERWHMWLAIQAARRGALERAFAHRANAGAVGHDAVLANRLGVVLAARGDVGPAEALFREQIRRHPADPRPRAYLARLLRDEGREGEASGLQGGPSSAPPASVPEVGAHAEHTSDSDG